MRYIKNPGPVTLKDLKTGKEIKGAEWTLHSFLVNVVLPDPAMGKGFKADLARFTVEAAARDEKKWLEVEDEHWEMLKESVEKPTGEMDNRARMQLLPFQRAIVDAPSEDPRKQKKGK